MSASNFLYLEDAEVVRTTDAAILINYDGAQHWIPKSQTAPDDREMISGLVPGDVVTLGITEWIADQKGIDA